MQETGQKRQGCRPDESSGTRTRSSLSHVPEIVVEQMKILRSGNPGTLIMELFGISDNSWRRLRSGQPLRHSVAIRLVERIAMHRRDARAVSTPDDRNTA